MDILDMCVDGSDEDPDWIDLGKESAWATEADAEDEDADA